MESGLHRILRGLIEESGDSPFARIVMQVAREPVSLPAGERPTVQPLREILAQARGGRAR